MNNLLNDTQDRIGFYLELLEYLSTNRQLPNADSRVSFKQTDKDFQFLGLDMVDKFKQLKDLQAKVNEKVLVLEQKLAGGLTLDQNINESYYEQLSSRFQDCRDLADVTEKDVLVEIQVKIDLNKEEEVIESFIKEKKKNSGSNGPEIEVFTIYKLKSKVMNEKIDKIKRQFEDQSSTVDSIRKIFDENITKLTSDILELRKVGTLEDDTEDL